MVDYNFILRAATEHMEFVLKDYPGKLKSVKNHPDFLKAIDAIKRNLNMYVREGWITTDRAPVLRFIQEQARLKIDQLSDDQNFTHYGELQEIREKELAKKKQSG